MRIKISIKQSLSWRIQCQILLLIMPVKHDTKILRKTAFKGRLSLIKTLYKNWATVMPVALWKQWQKYETLHSLVGYFVSTLDQKFHGQLCSPYPSASVMMWLRLGRVDSEAVKTAVKLWTISVKTREMAASSIAIDFNRLNGVRRLDSWIKRKFFCSEFLLANSSFPCSFANSSENTIDFCWSLLFGEVRNFCVK